MTDEQVQMLCEVLKDITKALDRNNATLETILGHYCLLYTSPSPRD